MTTWATQAETARILGMSRQNLGKLLKRRIISGKAVMGKGRDLRIEVDLARKQVKARRDVGQAITNGAKTKVAPAKDRAPLAAPPVDDDQDDATDLGTDLDEAIKREKLVEIQGRNRRAAEDEAARSGRYTDTIAAIAAMTRMAVDLLRMFDGAVADLAADVAARHQSDGREELHAMRKAFTATRTRMASEAARAAAAVPRLVPQPAPAAAED